MSAPGKRVVDIRRWGPAMWDVLYAIAFAYPAAPSQTEKEAATAYFSSLQHILPCNHCRDHFAAFVAHNPIAVDSSEDLSNWVLRLNNDVNARTGKPQLSMDEVWDRLVENGHVQRRQCMATLVLAIGVGAVFAYLLWRVMGKGRRSK